MAATIWDGGVCTLLLWVRLVFEGSLHLKIGQPCRKLYSESGFTCSLITANLHVIFLSVQQTHQQECSHFPEKRRFPHSLSVESWFLRNKLSEWYVRSENDCFSPSPLRQLPLIISRKWQGYVAYRCRGRLVCYLSLSSSFLKIFNQSSIMVKCRHHIRLDKD